MIIRAFALCHALRCPPPLSNCPHCFGIHRRESPPSTFPRPPQSTSSPHAQLPSPPPPPPSSTVHPNRLIAPSCRHYHLLCIANSNTPPPPPPAPSPPSPPLPSPLHRLLESSVISCSCSDTASSAALIPSSAKIETSYPI